MFILPFLLPGPGPPPRAPTQLEKRLVGMRDICFAVDTLQRTGQMFQKPPAWRVGPPPDLPATAHAEFAWLVEWLLETKV